MNLLQAYPTYDKFSNDGWIPQQAGSYDSLESLHGQLHGLIGNGGHMGVVSSFLSFAPHGPHAELDHGGSPLEHGESFLRTPQANI